MNMILDYYFDANEMTHTIDNSTISPTIAGQHGFATMTTILDITVVLFFL